MPERHSRLGRYSWALGVPGIALALAWPFAVAQQPVPAQRAVIIGQRVVPDTKPAEDANTDAISLPRNPESKRLIQAAQDYIKKKEWRIAAECLQNLLENPDDSFIEVRRKDAQGVEQDVKVSVRDEANRIIGELPADGLESYQVQYGQAAANRLREATERADPAVLAEVSQRYFHTKSGLEATNLLGTYHLDRGQYLMASLCFERLLSRPDADKLAPKILFKAALAYRGSGDGAAAEKLVGKISDRIGRGDVAFSRLRLTVDQLRTELNRDYGGEAVFGLFDWPLFRGNSHRNARGQGGAAYLIPDWAVSMYKKDDASDPGDKPATIWIDQHLDIAFQSMKDKPILPAFFPVSAGNRLLVRTYDGVSAHALTTGQYTVGEKEVSKKRGDLLWHSSAERSLFYSIRQDDRGQRPTITQWYNQNYRGSNNGMVGVFFENSVLGTISHDGKRAYFIDDLGVPPHPYMLMTANFGGSINFGPFNDDVQNNRLQAADLSTGKLSWGRLGGKGPAPTGVAPSSATELLDSFFLSPPLPLGGKLYLLTEKNGELRLVCLDPEKLQQSPLVANEQVPELVWVQSLGTASSKLPADSFRRLQAAHLAYGDGILVCPTNVGAVIGVDLLTHSLAWAYSYRKVPAPQGNGEEMMWRRPRYNNTTPTERWRASAPVVVKDRVVLTSQDSTHVDCLNLRDGRKLWSVARDEADLYLAGVYDGRVLIVNRNSVKALDLQTGKLVWNQAKTGMPAGQGVTGDGVYYLPLASSLDLSSSERGPEICALDVKTGKILGRSKAREEPLGNLLFVGGDLISQSATTIASFPLLKAKQVEINRALAKNANDATGLTERGEMYLYDGAIPQAVADLRSALANNPTPGVREKARTKLFIALTKWMQSDFNAAEKYLGEFEELCKVEDADEYTRRRASYLELLGRGRERQGRIFDAFSAYEQYGKLGGNRELVASIEEPNTKARPDIWSRGRIQALIASAKPDDKKSIEAEINRRWEKLRASANLDELRSFVGLYGSLSAAGMSARLELANRLIVTGDPDELTEAERVLASLCYGAVQRDDDPALVARALDLMITLCMRRSQFENAVGFYKRLGTEFGDVTVRDGRTGRELWNDLPTDKRFIPYLETPGIIWPGNWSIREENRNMPVRQGTTFTLEPSGELQPFFERHRVLFDVREDGMTGTLRIVDRTTNEERRLPYHLPAPRGMANYNLQAWDGGLRTNYDGRQPIAYARGDDLILHINNMVYAFDLVERKELWKKNLYGKDPLLNSQENHFESDENNNTIVVMNDKKFPLGRIAAVEAPYVALQTRDGLEVLDPVMPGPNTLWTKSDVGMNATVFGDNRRIFVLDSDPDKGAPRLRILNAANGVAETLPDNIEALAKKLTEANPKKLRILRGKLLIADQGGKTLRLIDPSSGKDVWSREFSNGTVVVRCDDQFLVGAVESAGLFTLLNALTGEVQFTSRLRAEDLEKLSAATLVSDRDHYYLVLARQPDQGMQSQSAMRNTMRSVAANGHVYALFKKSGKLDWTSCKAIDHQYLVMDQMADLPVLLFTTQFSKSTNNVLEEQGVKVTGIIKSNGKLIVDKKYHTNTEFHALLPSPSTGKIELLRQDLKLTIESKKQ